MNFENWIPIIYKPKTNTENKKKKGKKRGFLLRLRNPQAHHPH